MQRVVLTEREIRKLESQANIKHRTIWAIARFTAARSCEVLRLRVGNVYSKNGQPLGEIFFPKAIRKGQIKDLYVPVSENLGDYLLRYRPEGKSDDFLFPGKVEGSHLSYIGAYTYLQWCKEAAGIDRAIGYHSFRRTCLTRLSEAGIRLEVIQSISGHQTLDTLKHYLDVTETARIEALSLLTY
jgi:integrase/recombinase XerD